MLNYIRNIKIASVSLAVSFAIATGISAQTLNLRNEDAPSVRHTAYQVTSAIAEGALEGTKAIANTGLYVATKAASAGFYVASHVANNAARYGVAYLTAYAGVEICGELAAYGMYGAAYTIGALSAGPVGTGAAAGLVAYSTTKAVLTGLRYIPGIDGALAAIYTPTVRVFTDTVIDHGPAAVIATASTAYAVTSAAASTAYSTISAAASLAQTGFSSIYSSFYSL